MRGVIMAEKKKKPYEIGELDQYLFGQGNHYEIYKNIILYKQAKRKSFDRLVCQNSFKIRPVNPVLDSFLQVFVFVKF